MNISYSYPQLEAAATWMLHNNPDLKNYEQIYGEHLSVRTLMNRILLLAQTHAQSFQALGFYVLLFQRETDSTHIDVYVDISAGKNLDHDSTHIDHVNSKFQGYNELWSNPKIEPFGPIQS